MQHRFDVDALKRDNAIEDVVSGYGVELRRSGRALVGRCPFHHDQGRPNLHVYADSASWFCYRCGIGGDALSFVMRYDGASFPAACARLADAPVAAASRPPPRASVGPRRNERRPPAWGSPERACLAAAVELYQNSLQTAPTALGYVVGRSIDRTTIERCRVGFAAGGELATFLRWRRLPVGAAHRAGLLTRDGRETMAGRVVVPELRDGQAVWLVGRVLASDHPRPKYLGLAGRKALLGWDAAARSRAVWLVEGVFDWLTLRGWGLPALCLLGTRARAEDVSALARFERVHVAFDADDAGQQAAAALRAALGPRAVPVPMPGVEDVAELAGRRDGRATFLRATSQGQRARAA